MVFIFIYDKNSDNINKYILFGKNIAYITYN